MNTISNLYIHTCDPFPNGDVKNIPIQITSYKNRNCMIENSSSDYIYQFQLVLLITVSNLAVSITNYGKLWY